VLATDLELLTLVHPALVLLVATAVWLGVSILIWRLRKSRICRHR
jgi:hypothetical protein